MLGTGFSLGEEGLEPPLAPPAPAVAEVLALALVLALVDVVMMPLVTTFTPVQAPPAPVDPLTNDGLAATAVVAAVVAPEVVLVPVEGVEPPVVPVVRPAIAAAVVVEMEFEDVEVVVVVVEVGLVPPTPASPCPCALGEVPVTAEAVVLAALLFFKLS